MQFEYSCMSYLCMYASWTAPYMGWCVCVLAQARPCVRCLRVCVCEQVPTYCTLPAVHFHAPQSQSSGYPRFCCCCSYSHLPKAKHRMIEAEQEREKNTRLCNTLQHYLKSPLRLALRDSVAYSPHSHFTGCAHTPHTANESRPRQTLAWIANRA